MCQRALFLAGLLVVLLAASPAGAGVLIELSTSGTTGIPSGTSGFYVSGLSGTLDPVKKSPEDLGLEADSTEITIPLLDKMDPGRTYSIQMDEITWCAGDGDNAANSGATYTVRVRYSNEDGSWSLSGVSTVVDGRAISGATREPTEFTLPPCRYARVEIISGITRFLKATAKLLIP